MFLTVRLHAFNAAPCYFPIYPEDFYTAAATRFSVIGWGIANDETNFVSVIHFYNALLSFEAFVFGDAILLDRCHV